MLLYAVSEGKVLQLMDRIAFEMKGDLKLAVKPSNWFLHVPSTGANSPCSLFISHFPFFHFLRWAPWLHHTVWTCNRINVTWSLGLYSARIYVNRRGVHGTGKQAGWQQLQVLLVTSAARMCRRKHQVWRARSWESSDGTLTWVMRLWVRASPLCPWGWRRIFSLCAISHGWTGLFGQWGSMCWLLQGPVTLGSAGAREDPKSARWPCVSYRAVANLANPLWATAVLGAGFGVLSPAPCIFLQSHQGCPARVHGAQGHLCPAPPAPQLWWAGLARRYLSFPSPKGAAAELEIPTRGWCVSVLGGWRALAGLEANLLGGTGSAAMWMWDLGNRAPLHSQGGFNVTVTHQSSHLPVR